MKRLRGILEICLLAALLAHIGCNLYQNFSVEAEVVENTVAGFDLKLPGEVHKRTITEKQVQVQLSNIGELATYLGSYSVDESDLDTRYIFDIIPVAGTTNEIKISCNGSVKVGFDINKIKVRVDNVSHKIYVTLPEPQILDNYIIWDSVRVEEDNCIFNPIEFSQYQNLISELQEDGLKKVQDEGIIQKASDNTAVLIKGFLSCFKDYEVDFI